MFWKHMSKYLNSTRIMKRCWRDKFALGLANVNSWCLPTTKILCISEIIFSLPQRLPTLPRRLSMTNENQGLSTYVSNCGRSRILNSFFAFMLFFPFSSHCLHIYFDQDTFLVIIIWACTVTCYVFSAVLPWPIQFDRVSEKGKSMFPAEFRY